MKYKILINGKKSALTRDFFMYTADRFQCLSTSNFWQDVINHLALFQPDAYVCFFDTSDGELLTQMETLKNHEKYCNVPIVVVGDAEACEILLKKAVKPADLIIQRPVSTGEMMTSILKFLKQREQEHQEEEKSEQAETKNEGAILRGAELEEAILAAERALALKKHILVIDDDKSILKLLKTALEENYQVTTMVTGRMAGRFLESKAADLILLDYEMPDMTGPEVFESIRQNPKARNIPIVFLTGVTDRNKILKVLELKPQGYLLKPIDMDKLFTTINNIINGYR